MIETSRLWGHRFLLRRFGLNRYGLWRNTRRNEFAFSCNTRQNIDALRVDDLDPPGFDVEPLKQCALAILDWAQAGSVWVLQRTDDPIDPWRDWALTDEPSSARLALLSLDARLRAVGVRPRCRRPLRLRRPWEEDACVLFSYMLSNRVLEPFLVPSTGRCVVKLHHGKQLVVLPRDEAAAAAVRTIALDHGMQLSAGEPARPFEMVSAAPPEE